MYAFLGVQVNKNASGKIQFQQVGLINLILKHCNMSECNAKAIPCEATPLGTDAQGKVIQDRWNYASAIGMLMYLPSNAYPEIQYAVHQCACFTHCPKHIHEEAVQRICRYLQGIKELRGLQFNPTQELQLDCYVDADFAGLWKYEDDQDPACVKSRTGYILNLGGCHLICIRKLQQGIHLSATDAEYIALSQAMTDVIPLCALLLEVQEQLQLGPSSSIL